MLQSRHKLAEWIQKQDLCICCLQESHFRPKDTYRLKVEGWKNIFHASGNQKKVGVAIFISDKIDVKIKTVTKNKEGQDIMKTGPTQEDITIINTNSPNIEAPQYIMQILTTTKGETDSNRVTEGDFNTPITPMDRSSRQKIYKETQALNHILAQMELTEISRTFHPKTAEYTFFSTEHGTFSRMDYILVTNQALENLRKLKLYQAYFLTTMLCNLISITGKERKL